MICTTQEHEIIENGVSLMNKNIENYIVIRTKDPLGLASKLGITKSLHTEFEDLLSRPEGKMIDVRSCSGSIVKQELAIALGKLTGSEVPDYRAIKEFSEATGVELVVSYEHGEYKDYIDKQGLYPDDSMPKMSKCEGMYSTSKNSVSPIIGAEILIYRIYQKAEENELLLA